MPGVARGAGGDDVRGAGGDDLAALVAAVGAEVDDPVGGFDDVEIVFDDDDGVALVDEGVEDFEEFADVFEVEAGRGFIEDVEGLPGGAAGEFLGELDALRFAAATGLSPAGRS